MPHKNNYEAQLELIKGENVNVGTKSELKDFSVLLGGIVGVVLVFLISFNTVSTFFIDKMSTESQLRIESLFKSKEKIEIPEKYKQQIFLLENIKQRIIENDVSIQGKSQLNINVLKSKEINAMIIPDGSILFTTKLLDENLSEEELAFVLAHEIGHYSNKDHLKSISKQIAYAIICAVAGLDSKVNSIAQGVSEIEFLSHSREQEKEADLYANKMLIRIYGTNEGAKSFIKKLQNKENLPEFIHYFSTHPSWNERLELVETSNK